MPLPDEVPCPFCKELIKIGAIKCRFCGEFLGGPAGQDAAAANGAVAPTPGAGDVIFEGNVSAIVLFRPALVALCAAALALLILVYDDELVGLVQSAGNEDDTARHICWAIAASVFLAGLLFYGVKWLARRSRHYRITGGRIEYEHGMLFKRVENMDTWRMQDISLTQSLPQRIFGLGTVRILSSDQTDPQLDIGPIPRARKVYDALKQVQVEADRRGGVVHVEK
jgi:membrane protein YdbS with pleckstrin-like domain